MYVRPVCFPAEADIKFDTNQSIGTVVGWGATNGSLTIQDKPAKATVITSTNERCFLHRPNVLAISSLQTFCAIGENTGPCSGDSGGGFFEKIDNSWTIRGIISATTLINSQCDLSQYTVYTNVGMFYDWIKETINSTCADIPQRSCLVQEPRPKILKPNKKNVETSSSPEIITIIRKSESTFEGDINNHRNIGQVNEKHCGFSSLIRITNGEEAALHQFPWLGLLQYQTRDDEKRKSFKCSGTLITPNTVLSAAHCILMQNDELFSVRFGEHNFKKTKDCVNDTDPSTCSPWEVEDYPIQSIIVHANYDSVTKENDIALIHLNSSVVLSKARYHVRTICLPVNETQQIDNVGEELKKLTIAGWGTTEYSKSKSSDVLMFAKVQYREQNDCEDFYATQRMAHPSLTLKIKDRMMCAGGEAKVDICRGDSGGPLMGLAEKNTFHRTFQHGIVAAGVECSQNIPFPGIYTRVTKFLSWILDNLPST